MAHDAPEFRGSLLQSLEVHCEHNFFMAMAITSS